MQATFRFEPPSPSLRGWVRQHQIIRLRFPPGASVPPKPYWPRPAACLAFYLRDREAITRTDAGALKVKPRTALIGQPTLTTLRHGGSDFSVYQIEFEPGALHRLTGIPQCELLDSYIDAEAALPADFRALVDRLEQLEDCDAIIARAEAYILALVSRSTRGPAASDRIALAVLNGSRLIEPLAEAANISSRQMHRQFLTRMGVGPKLLARVARFDRAVRLALVQPEETWLGIALDAGYHDHQHLARDFRMFTDMSPSEFARMERRSPEREFNYQEG